MTERLYDDGLLLEFDAAVTDVRKTSKGYEIILDRSAFFPEGGGQPGDVGIIGTARVIDTYEQNGQVVHLCTSPLQIGAAVHCSVDEDIRIRRMQGHSGEHLIMGFIHKKLGLDNVGFRLGSSYVTLDLDGEISMDDLRECEQQANLAIAKDIPIRISYPDAEELAKLEYRSKLSVDEGIRIVTIEGIDRCACCAPHFPSTGSIGMVRVLSAQSYKGGTRVYILCGLDALDLFRERTETVTSISVLLSAKPEKTAEAVKKLYDENNALKKRLYD
ncbi:MAG: alanyl-tRNA editing protein, partial [Ruminococcus sp.]|nr:alanyl-tRNA editing protein [Ruminococcus sp.]